MMGTEWDDATFILNTIAQFIANRELNEQTIDGQTMDGDNIRVTIRHGRTTGAAGDAGYSVNAYVARGNGICRMTLRINPY